MEALTWKGPMTEGQDDDSGRLAISQTSAAIMPSRQRNSAHVNACPWEGSITECATPFDGAHAFGSLRNTQPVFLLSTDAWLVLVGAAAQPLSKVLCHEIQRAVSFTNAFNGGWGGGVRSPLGNILCADGLS